MFLNKITAYSNMDTVEGEVLVRDISEITCSNGKTAYFITGVTQNGDYKIKCWSADIVTSVVSSYIELKNKVITIKGIIKEYKGSLEISATNIVLQNQEGINLTEFCESLNYEAIKNDFLGLLRTSLSENAFKALAEVFNHNNIFEKFVKGYAATSHHDNKVGGLINHTTKMLKILKAVIENDDRLKPYSDILYLSCTLHDIGKVYEYTEMGGYAPDGFVDHKAYGIQILTEVKSEMLKYIDKDTYNRIISVILGHHGEYGERPHTIYAQIIHLIDMVDSQVTSILEEVDKALKDDNGGKSIRYNGSILSV